MKTWLTMLMAVLFAATPLVGCDDGSSPDPDPEICDNEVDDDEDGLTDCEDGDCFTHDSCIGEVEDCENEVDDDGDGDVDCEDSDCDDDPACEVTDPEICDNGVDDDGDGNVDCDDIDCGGDPACPDTEDCDNGVDDDGDGDVDCDDSQCAGEPVCDPDEEICDNGADDDGDGDVDCDDADCTGDPACDPDEEICDNGTDDDGDGDIDCDDADCGGDPACPDTEDCDNGADDDGDGDIDCADADCVGAVVCTEDCDSGVDEDLDGDIDCADSDCLGDPACAEDCGNGVDDDFDGDVDCADSDCVGDPACAEDCGNGVDDDLDGAIDCADSDCDSDPACAEDCDNGADDDGDGLVDCFDDSCDHDLACAELCNGIDDDGDGIVDEFPIDPGIGSSCYEGPAAEAGVGQCDEGVTECLDGDLECVGWVPSSTELCDGIDNDCDGSIPASEADCSTTVETGDLTRLEFETEERDVDVHINLDTTGSMGGELATLRTTMSDIVSHYRASLPNAAFGLSTFEDFPITPFGASTDEPFALHERMTVRVWRISTALDTISLGSGMDGPESGIESLFQIADGSGVTWTGGSAAAFDWTRGYVDGWHGSIGGVGFRETAIPMIVHITDAVSHESGDYTASGITAHTTTETYAALNAIGAKVIGVRTGTLWGTGVEPIDVVMATDTIVPVCAFDGAPARIAGTCAADECCTGIDGAGVAAMPGDECPLDFQTSATGAGLDESIITGIDALARFATYEMTVAFRDDPSNAVDATCFVESYAIVASAGAGGTCAVDPLGVDSDGDGTIDTLLDATPLTRATFQIEAVNVDVNDVDGDGDFAEACAAAGTYGLFLDVVADGTTVVSSRRLEVVVP